MCWSVSRQDIVPAGGFAGASAISHNLPVSLLGRAGGRHHNNELSPTYPASHCLWLSNGAHKQQSITRLSVLHFPGGFQICCYCCIEKCWQASTNVINYHEAGKVKPAAALAMYLGTSRAELREGAEEVGSFPTQKSNEYLCFNVLSQSMAMSRLVCRNHACRCSRG